MIKAIRAILLRLEDEVLLSRSLRESQHLNRIATKNLDNAVKEMLRK